MALNLPLANLDAVGAKVIEHEEGFAVITATTREGNGIGLFKPPVDPLAFASADITKVPAPGWTTQKAIGAIAELDYLTARVNTDQRLTPFGRSEKLAEPRERALKSVLTCLQALENNATGLDEQRAQRYRVPAVDRTDLVEALRQSEIRTWLRSVRDDDRAALYDELAEGNDSPLLRAVLHSPVRMGNIEKMAQQGWRTRIDREDPEGLANIEFAGRSIEWARSVLIPVRTLLLQRLNYSAEDLFAKVGNDATFFGMSQPQIEYQKRLKMAREAAA